MLERMSYTDLDDRLYGLILARMSLGKGEKVRSDALVLKGHLGPMTRRLPDCATVPDASPIRFSPVYRGWQLKSR